MPIDFGTHHFLNSSGFVHASNTRRAGASKVRVTTSSRQCAEARVPQLLISLDPRRRFLEAARADPAVAYAADLLGGDEPRPFQHAHVLLHAGERHVEPVGEVRDRGFRTAELLEHAAPGRVRQRREHGIEVGLRILNHMVQYISTRSRVMQVGCEGPEERCSCGRAADAREQVERTGLEPVTPACKAKSG